ncbi:MAG: hypothetical protein ACO3K7_03265 [Candidatus Marinamargulisbacteria bacterium]
MNKMVKFFKWFINEERGNALLLTTATALMATIGIFFFTALRQMSIKNKERTTHLYNASVMGMAIDGYIRTHLSTLPYPKNKLVNNNTAQFSPDELSQLVNIDNFDILSLDDLEQNGYIVSHDDPTPLRELNLEQTYDKNATKIRIEFKLNDDNKIEDIYYLVNLAGAVYSNNNAPYSADEPFFYIVSFTDDIGDGNYGSYDLIDNDITLTDSNGVPLESILEANGTAPIFRQVVRLPGDST